MHLAKEPKIFYELFIAFLESASKFQHFEKKMSLRGQVIQKL